MPGNLPNLLMVEGKNDRHVVYALCKRLEVPQCFEVKEYEGVDRLLEALPERLDETGRERLGIVVDADPAVGLDARWESLAGILRRRYSGIASGPDPTGTVLRAPDAFLPVVGVWLMPDNRIPGRLEQFLQVLIPDDDELFPRARAAVGGIPPDERRFRPAHEAKAEIHTWLAWQEEPGLPFGVAITARYLDGNRPQAQEFASWLRRLFVDESPLFARPT